MVKWLGLKQLYATSGPGRERPHVAHMVRHFGTHVVRPGGAQHAVGLGAGDVAMGCVAGFQTYYFRDKDVKALD